MRPCHLIPLIALAASAQDPWKPVLEARRQELETLRPGLGTALTTPPAE